MSADDTKVQRRTPDEMLERYRGLPDGETVKEAARLIEGRNRPLANRLREIAKERSLPTADSVLADNLARAAAARAKDP